MDLSEQCGHTIEEQLQLFTNIKPLFVNKPIIAVMNKTDIIRPDELTDENKERLAYFKTEGTLIYLETCMLENNTNFDNCMSVI
jgi:nucleolar GTP-binding protein